MGIKDLIIRLTPNKLILLSRKFRSYWGTVTKKNMQRKQSIPILHIHLADHCNLDCRGCDNFSPIAPAVFADVSTFENDCKQISKLCGDKIDEIQLLGGEPLLHRQIVDFIEIARKYFPNNKIVIISNGVLIPRMKADFWETCRKNNIEIIVTKYPIKLDFDAIRNKAESENIKFSFYGNTEKIDKTMQCTPLDLEGKQNGKDSFLRCSRANRCVAMDNGKMYTCSLIPYVKYFNTQFNKDLKITNKDYLDIYKVKNADEILDFLCKPMPFCRYCNIKGTIYDIGYGISKKEISEWIG